MLITVRTKPATLAVGVTLSVATMMMPHQAAAQFVCGGSATGAEPQTGAGAVATGFISVSCGPSAGNSPNAGNSGNSSFGAFAGGNVNGTENTAVGLFAGSVVTGNHNIAVGAFSGGAITGSDNVALGTGAGVSLQGSNNVAIGLGAGSGTLVPVTASNTVAIGNSALASADNAMAIGNGASADFLNSAAFGSGATATRANQQVFGTASNTYTLSGLTSAASLAAQTGPLQIVTSDAAGNLATDTAAGLGLATTSQISAINSQLSTINGQIGLLSNRIDDVSKEARRGIAAAVAMAHAPTPTRPGRTTVAINGSVYQDTGGVGVAFQHRFAGTSLPVYFSGAYGNGGGREHVGRAGFAFEW